MLEYLGFFFIYLSFSFELAGQYFLTFTLKILIYPNEKLIKYLLWSFTRLNISKTTSVKTSGFVH